MKNNEKIVGTGTKPLTNRSIGLTFSVLAICTDAGGVVITSYIVLSVIL